MCSPYTQYVSMLFTCLLAMRVESCYYTVPALTLPLQQPLVIWGWLCSYFFMLHSGRTLWITMFGNSIYSMLALGTMPILEIFPVGSLWILTLCLYQGLLSQILLDLGLWTLSYQGENIKGEKVTVYPFSQHPHKLWPVAFSLLGPILPYFP